MSGAVLTNVSGDDDAQDDFHGTAGYLFKKFQGRKQTYGTRDMNRS
jgi:hypothetical protein